MAMDDFKPRVFTSYPEFVRKQTEVINGFNEQSVASLENLFNLLPMMDVDLKRALF